jgi:cytochrome c-type biogenesis protein CcmF
MWSPLVRRIKRGESFGAALIDGQLRRGRRRFASYIVHAGVVVAIIAIAVSSSLRSVAEVTVTRGGSATLAGYTVTLLGVEERPEPHRHSTVARFAVARGSAQKTILEPRMNQYLAMREPIGSPDVYTTAGGDLYLSLMNVDSARQSVGVSIIHAPMVVWIWIAVMLMGVGGLVALIPAALTRSYVIPSVSEGSGRAVGALTVGDEA